VNGINFAQSFFCVLLLSRRVVRATVISWLLHLCIPWPNTHLIVLLVMQMISDGKASIMAEKMVLSNKTKIAVAAAGDVIESLIVNFDKSIDEM
jgi:hypothetical protein